MAHRRFLHGTPGQVGFPGFPVESCGFEQLHVVLFKENHISGTGESCEVGNPGALPRHAGAGGMTNRRGLLKGKGPLPRDRAVVGPFDKHPLLRQHLLLCERKRVTGSPTARRGRRDEKGFVRPEGGGEFLTLTGGKSSVVAG
jgi:hypothetical protein